MTAGSSVQASSIVRVLDYPLLLSDAKTEYLRVAARYSMSMAFLIRLIADICTVLETLMQTDAVDLAA